MTQESNTSVESSSIFVELGDLMLEGRATPAEIACAISLEGIQAFDRFGRYIKLLPGKDAAPYAGVSIEGAISALDRLVTEECSRIYNNDEDPREHNEYWRRKAELPFVHTYGWKESELPNFKECHERWSQQYAGRELSEVPTRDSEVGSRSERSVKQIIRGLVKIGFTEKVVAALDRDVSPSVAFISNRLQQEGVTVSDKTLRKWLKMS